MTLDDFFTLTEMNNGLTVPSRVEELVTVMQKEKNCVVKNVGEATRQWSAVGSAIAATENQDCLDLFVQLDGLQLIGKWLKDAKALINDTNDSFVEESITHLLQALGKLHVDYEKLVAAEIWTAVEELVVHNSSKVQEKARILFESWKRKRDGDVSLPEAEQSGALADDEVKKSEENSEVSQRDDSLSRVTSPKEKCQESTRDDTILSTSSDAVNPCQVENEHNSGKKVDPLVVTSIESCNSAVSRQDTPDVRTEFNELESASDIKHTTKAESSPEKQELLEKSHTPEDTTFPSSSDAAVDATESVTGSASEKFTVAGKEGSSFPDSMKIDSDASRSGGALAAEQVGENSKLSSKSTSVEKSWGNTKELYAFISGIENHGKIKKLDLHVSGDNLANDYKFSKRGKRREPDHSGKKSDAELYGIVDPLELVRQVAIEVEREVGDYREHSCSSSEKLPEGKAEKPESSASLSGKQSHSESSLKEAENESSSEASSLQEESAEKLEAEQTNGPEDTNTSQITETAQEEAKTEKGFCNFDLNEEVFSEEAERPANQYSTPVSIVSASRAAAAPGQPVAPLQFEGNLGWKGSAATSAFRPASPRRIHDHEKDVSSSSSSKQRLGFLDIDLNVSESNEDKTVPLFSSLLPSGESSDSRKSERLELDLNRTSEDGSRPLDFQMGQFYTRSHSSSSSSKQPSLKNIDLNLNDQPTSFLNDSSDNSYLSKLSHNFGIKSDDSISIMGTRVEVNRPNLSLQQNGRTSGLAFDVNLGRFHPYNTHSSVYGYNNITSGPTLQPFSSPIYGSGPPIPYMVDSRGAPVIPQIVGSSSALPNFSQTPFFINMAGPPPSNGIVGGVGPSRSNFDLNSDGGNREPAGFTQFLSSGQIRSMDEQLRSNSQPTINLGGKRKEPENGWEQYPFKHYTPPWK